MIEILAVAVLALHGIVCAAILVVFVRRAARARDARWEIPVSTAPDKIEPPDLGLPDLDRNPAPEVFAIMREYFPEEYERHRSGQLGYAERRWLWEACCSIRDARSEIEELCS